MATRSSIHVYLNWAKERIDEMDAALLSLENRSSDLRSEARAGADRLWVDLRKKRDDFRETVKKQSEANEAAWIKTKAQLDAEWHAFEVDVKNYIQNFGDQVTQRQATFKLQADAQLKAWREAIDTFRSAGEQFAGESRAKIDAGVKRMEADATVAQQKLERLKQAGAQSWPALTAALEETRTSFDRANQAAQEAFRKALT